MKILFYTGVPRLFTSTMIGHLYEIAQKHEVVLVKEKLDALTEAILRDKKIFPKISKFIEISQYSGQKNTIGGLFRKNREFSALAEKIIRENRPDFVIAENDITLFELYLFREAKKNGATNLCFQAGMRLETPKLLDWVYKENEKKYFRFLHPSFKLFFEKFRRTAGHYFYYWLLPLFAGQPPFFGKASVVRWNWISGLRDADYLAVFSERDERINIKEGVNPKKILILAHPFSRKECDGFKKVFFKGADLAGAKKKALLVLPGSYDEKTAFSAIKQISKILEGWDVVLKPHPASSNLLRFSGFLILGKDEIVEKYFESADLLISFTPSTVLYSFKIQHPAKPSVLLDIFSDPRSGTYKEAEEIKYIKKPEELESVLMEKAPANNKKQSRKSKTPNKFSNTIELIDNVKKWI